MFKGILKRAVATAVVAASVFLAVIFLGVAVFYALQLMTTPLGAAAITFGLFALTAEDAPDAAGDAPVLGSALRWAHPAPLLRRAAPRRRRCYRYRCRYISS
jgi:hypothetical protein